MSQISWKITRKPRVAQNRKVAHMVKTVLSCAFGDDDFHEWFSSIEGGHFVPDFLEDYKKTQRVAQNRKVAHMVKSVLSCAFRDDDFHISKLAELITMGRKSPSVISKLAEGLTWSTVRNYLHAFSHFLAFLGVSLPAGLQGGP